MRKLKNRKGFSLIELIVAVIVLGILATMVINSGASAQRRARISSALNALENYKTSFTSVCMSYPGVMKDREEAWKSATGYTTKQAMSEVVRYMNKNLEPELSLSWDTTLNCYKSAVEDPWGGYYIITEYPQQSGSTDGYDPTTGSGLSAMRFSIWSTGIDNGVLTDKKVSTKSIGISFIFRNGDITATYHGIEDDELPFIDYELKWN